MGRGGETIRRRRLRLCARPAGWALALGALLACVAPASAGEPGTEIAHARSYGVDPVSITLGSSGQLKLRNNDPFFHNLTAVEIGPDRKPLFRSSNVRGLTTAAVRGEQYLESGDYDFYCTFHAGSMLATLHVDDAPEGEAVPRPDLTVELLSRRLAAVRRSGAVRARVSAAEPTAARDVYVKAVKSGRTLTRTRRVGMLPAGSARKVSLGLTKAGRRRLRRLGGRNVKVVGQVSFGAAGRARGNLAG